MTATLSADSIIANVTWTDEQFRYYQKAIRDKTSKGLVQHLRIQDKAGTTLAFCGKGKAVSQLSRLQQFGFPSSFAGMNVLDMGCNAGLFSFLAHILGAKHVLGLDRNPYYIDQALLARDIIGLSHQDVTFLVEDGHKLTTDSAKFDFVINMGVLYHLKNPMDFLEKVSAVTLHTMLIETEVLVDQTYSDYSWFIEGTYLADRSNWWIFGQRCLERMLRASGFPSVAFQGFLYEPPQGTRTPEGHLRQARGVFLCHK